MSADETALSRQLALLKQLQGRGLARASEHFAQTLAQPEDSTAPDKPRGRGLDLFFPEAERLAHEALSCRRVRVSATHCGRPTRQGYTCPAQRFGGPPNPTQLAALTGDPCWAELDPERILYLDTETTSLAGASGTYTFLIGLGRFAGDRFEVDQYFMEDYRDEPALVEAVDEAIQSAQALVSYNGLTFDLPLLEVRWLLQRRRPKFPKLHLDLLHYARRLWRLRLPDCSLSTVETEILGHRRLSDVDGSWVPRIYFDFIRGVRPDRIVPVFDHHAQDIFSLGALLAAMCHAFENPDDPRFAHASDQYGLARLYEHRGRPEDAIRRLEAAVLAARDEDLGFRLAMRLARIYKKLGRGEEAVAIWQARIGQARAHRLDPLIELAKYAEHAAGDAADARRWTLRALEMTRAAGELQWYTPQAGVSAPALQTAIAQLEHRLARLDKRLAKKA